MAKTSSQFVCSECGWSGPKWLGRCPECGQWGTIEEFHEARPSASSRTAAPGRTSRTLSHAVPDSAAKPITEISTENISRIDTGFTEFNRVLGGGIVPGSVTLIAGEPGIGKSTLLLETAGNVARLSAAQPERNTVLYISGEESQAQVRMRPRASARSNRICFWPPPPTCQPRWGLSNNASLRWPSSIPRKPSSRRKSMVSPEARLRCAKWRAR